MKPEINRTFIDHNFAKQQNKKRKEIQLNSLHGISASQVIIRDQEKPHNIALSINVCVQVSRAVIKIKTNCNKKKKMAGANEVYSFMRYGQTANYSKMAL